MSLLQRINIEKSIIILILSYFIRRISPFTILEKIEAITNRILQTDIHNFEFHFTGRYLHHHFISYFFPTKACAIGVW